MAQLLDRPQTINKQTPLDCVQEYSFTQTKDEEKLDKLRSLIGKQGNTARLILAGSINTETQHKDSLIVDPFLKYFSWNQKEWGVRERPLTQYKAKRAFIDTLVQLLLNNETLESIQYRFNSGDLNQSKGQVQQPPQLGKQFDVQDLKQQQQSQKCEQQQLQQQEEQEEEKVKGQNNVERTREDSIQAQSLDLDKLSKNPGLEHAQYQSIDQNFLENLRHQVYKYEKYLVKKNEATDLNNPIYISRSFTMHDVQISSLGDRKQKVDRYVTFLTMRKKFHEELVQQLCGNKNKWLQIDVGNRNQSVSQVVNLGCGFDTRPYLIDGIQDVDIIEVDTEDVINLKNEVFKYIGAQVDSHNENCLEAREFAYPLKCRSLRRVCCDLLSPTWMQTLKDNGYQEDKPTLWLMEGLLYYFELEYVKQFILKNILMNSCAGSYASFNYLNRINFEISRALYGQNTNSPMDFKSAFPSPVAQVFASLGWDIVDMFSYESMARYFSNKGLEPSAIHRTWEVCGIALLYKS